MKKIASIVSISVLLMIFGAQGAFAASTGGFTLEESNPTDGYEKVESTNVMIKLNFSEAISAKATQAENKGAFEFTDEDGNDVAYEIVYNSKDDKNVNLLVDEDLEKQKEYTVTISGDFASDDGDTLGEDQVLTFKTRGNSSTVGYFLLMVAMIVVMVVMTVRDQQKQMEAADATNVKLAIQTNPYKLAKEKGISVEEAQKLIAAERAKAEKKAAKAAGRVAAEPTAAAAPASTKKKPEKKVYKVKTKRTTKMHK